MLSSHSEKLILQFSLENLKARKGFNIIFPETPDSTYSYISLLSVVFVCLSVSGLRLSFRDFLRKSQILYPTAR